MRIDPSGVPIVAVGALAALACVVLGATAWSLACAALTAAFAFFFRDPHRQAPQEVDVVLAPADGRVLVAGAADRQVAPPGRWWQVSIFLSPFDVHVNRAPVSGRVVRVERRDGAKHPAYRSDAALRNARTEIWFETAGRVVVCRQVAGILARRVVCRLTPGMNVRAGDRFGIMRFGSRIDLFVPLEARLQVAPGERVRAGETVVARFGAAAGTVSAGEARGPATVGLDAPSASENNRA